MGERKPEKPYDSLLAIQVAEAGRMVANAITPRGVAGRSDAAGGHVESLTEAVMGQTAAICRVADALESIAEAIRATRE